MPTVSGVSLVHLEEDVRTTLVDASGTPYSDSNPFPVTGGTGGGGSSAPTITTSAGNTSTTPLAGGATFTGTYQAWGTAVGGALLVNTDSLAASNALHLDFSTDGVNTDRSLPIDLKTGGDWISFPRKGSSFRVRLTAGVGAQTFLRLQTVTSTAAFMSKLVPIADQLDDSSSALITKGVIAGRTTGGGGGIVDVKVNPSGALTVEANVTSTVGLTDAQLRASDVLVADDYDSDILTTDQTGAGAVLVFNLGVAAPFVTIDVDPTNPSDVNTYICRVTLKGETPTSAMGHRARSGQTTYLPFPTTGTVRVFAPTGVFVSVQAGTRT